MNISSLHALDEEFRNLDNIFPQAQKKMIIIVGDNNVNRV